MRGQPLGEGGVAHGVVLAGVLDRRDGGGVRDLRVHQALQQVAHPGRAGREAHREPVGGLGVGRGHSEAHVGSEELRHRPHERPPAVLRPDERVVRASREHREVVVLDDEHVGVVAQQRAQVGGTTRGEARARRVLRARGAHDRPHAVLERSAQAVDGHALAVDRNRHRPVAAEPDGVDARQEARILERHRIVARERLGEQPLHRVGRAAGYGEASGCRGRQPLGHPLLRPDLEVGIDHGLTVEHRPTRRPRERLLEPRDPVGIGVAGADIAQHAVGGEPLLGDNGVVGDVCAPASARDHDTRLGELAVGGDGGVAVDAELVGERAHRRQRVAGAEYPALDEGAEAVRDLRRGSSADLEVHGTALRGPSLGRGT